MANTLEFLITAKDQASKVFDQVGDSVDKHSGKIDKLKAMAPVAFAAAGLAVVGFAKSSVDAYTEAEASHQQLEDAYSRFPALANGNIDALDQLNAALAQKTVYDDDATAAAQANLAQYGLTQEQLIQLTPLVQDYAAKTGVDLATASDQLGKAMLGQGRALKGVGIDFQDTGSVAGNFDQIMSGLTTQVGGYAETVGGTAVGKTQILSNQFGEIQEKVGGALVPILGQLVDVGLRVVDWVQNNTTTVLVLGGALAALAVTIGIVNAVQAAFAAGQAIARGATLLVTAAQWAWNAAMFANPIGLVIVAIAALIAIVVLIATKTTWFQTIWEYMSGAVVAAAMWIWNNGIKPMATLVLGAFSTLANAVANFLDALSHVPGFGWAADAAAKIRGAANAADALASSINGIPSRKTVTVDVYQAVHGQVDGVIAGVAAQAGRNASGTPFWRGGLTWVGEEGPELLNLPRGSQILSNRDSVALTGAGPQSSPSSAAGAGAAGVLVQVYVSGSVVSERDLIRAVRDGLAQSEGRGDPVPVFS